MIQAIIQAIIDNLPNWIANKQTDHYGGFYYTLRHHTDKPGTSRAIITIDDNILAILTDDNYHKVTTIDLNHPDSLNQLHKALNQ